MSPHPCPDRPTPLPADTRRRGLRSCLLAAMLCTTASAADGGFHWPDGHTAAVSLGYDDALDSQLDHALPALDRRGFKASFYLPLSREAVIARLEDWRRAAASGHELGNHTLFHQCSGAAGGRGWIEPHRDLDAVSAAQMQDQARLASALLTAIDGRAERTFAVPCGETMAAGADYVTGLAPEFVAIRHHEGAMPGSLDQLDPAAVPVQVPAGASGAELIALVEAARARGGLVVLTFHGIGEAPLAVSVQAHEALLDHLAANRGAYWVDTFLSIMKHVRAERARRAD